LHLGLSLTLNLTRSWRQSLPCRLGLHLGLHLGLSLTLNLTRSWR
jgi:hypothetical protein